jgi:hypothetical protein
MLQWFKQLDRILRGEATRLSALRAGTIDLSVGGLVVVLVILSMLYGLCMGVFTMITTRGSNYPQMLASAVKVPALFFLTLLITFPSLYVFNALVGSRLRVASVLRLLVAAMGVMVTVLASLGTIVAFFSLSTSSYSFMIVLNVMVFGISGILGLMFLLQTLHRLTLVQDEELPVLPPPPSTEPNPQYLPRPSPEPSAIEPIQDQMLGRHVRVVFRIWIIVFGLVGAQMGWVLRPFIGSPNQPFSFFRPRHSNFFESVFAHLRNLLS